MTTVVWSKECPCCRRVIWEPKQAIRDDRGRQLHPACAERERQNRDIWGMEVIQ